MNALIFPGGVVTIDPELVWSKLQAWLATEPPRRCDLRSSPAAWHCRLSRSNGVELVEVSASSKLSLGDAVANALQAAEK